MRKEHIHYGRILPQHDSDFVRKCGGWGGYERFLRENDIAAPVYDWDKDKDKEVFVGLRVIHHPQTADLKVGRNEPCPCKSGKKYKKCCMNK